MKVSLIIVPLVLLACVVWFDSRFDEPGAAFGSDASQSASFTVRVEKPRMDRFLFGVLPTVIEEKLLGGDLRFSDASRDARAGSVGPDRVELRADGWDLLIEADGEGRIAPGTRLVFPIEIAEVQYTLRCRPADPATGSLRTTKREGSGELDGSFVVELAICVNNETGKTLDTEAGGNPGDAWPSAPLTLRGSFARLPQGGR